VFSANAAERLKVGVLFPTQARPRSPKHALAGPYLMGKASFSVQRRTGRKGAALEALSVDYWTSLCTEIRSTPHETLILSSECFFSRPMHRQPGLRERLSEVCDSVEVVAYLRAPAARFLSKMNQNFRWMRGVMLGRSDAFRPVIEGYREAGLDLLSLNVFAAGRLKNRDIVDDFFARYLPATLPPLTRQGGEHSNESVSTEALVILDELRAFVGDPMKKDPRRSQAVALLRAADQSLGGNMRPALWPEIEAALVSRATDLHRLRDTCGIVFDDVDYGAPATGLPDLTSLRQVSDFCLVDAARLDALRAMTQAPLAHLYRQGWFSRLRHRLGGRWG
jgi:hypothetical protein